jgi:hypothetical protein
MAAFAVAEASRSASSRRSTCSSSSCVLVHSLQRVFEDRLGMTLYTPRGHEWWDEGIWRFGEVFD